MSEMLQAKLLSEPELKPLARPMSAISKTFFTSRAMRISGELLEVNSDVLPNLPFEKEQIANVLSLFTDKTGRRADMHMLGLDDHKRSVSLNLTFSDKYGNVYRYVAIKGGGLSTAPPESKTFFRDIAYEREISYDREVWGLEDLVSARADWRASNAMLSKGIGTSVPIAIIKLNELALSSGEKVSIKELKRYGDLPLKVSLAGNEEDVRFTPVLYLIGYRENMRVSNARPYDYAAFRREYGLTSIRYREWFIKRFASNLARLHDLGKAHGNTRPHNITLDGCIVDNDTVETVEDYYRPSLFGRDLLGSFFCIEEFAPKQNSSQNVQAGSQAVIALKKLFMNHYFESRTNATEAQITSAINHLVLV